MRSMPVTSLHITNRKWVRMYLFFIGTYHLMTNRKCVRWLLMATSHYISNRKWVGLQFMSNTINSHLMINRESVLFLTQFVITFYVSTNFWQDVSVATFPSARQPHPVPQQIECEWSWKLELLVYKQYLISWARGWVQCYCAGQVHLTGLSHDQQEVSVLLLVQLKNHLILRLTECEQQSNLFWQVAWHILYYSASTVC